MKYLTFEVVTGPVARFARQIAGQGYICAAPSSYHEFTGPEALKYDAEDTDKGNLWKISKVFHRSYAFGECLRLMFSCRKYKPTTKMPPFQ